MTIKLLIADDEPLTRRSLRIILGAEPGFDVVGEAGDGEEAVRSTLRIQPDIVLMDIRMPKIDGLAATEQLLARNSPRPTKVLILTTFDLDEYVYRALKAGASGFLLKDAPPEQITAAIRLVHEADALFAPSITQRLVERYARPLPGVSDEEQHRIATLTAREREVFTLIARGLTNAQIATDLYLSEATVKTHVSHILSKLDLGSRATAVVLAYESGLVKPGFKHFP
jgi:DNA-binding NarL/FixJ family response regulator